MSGQPFSRFWRLPKRHLSQYLAAKQPVRHASANAIPYHPEPSPSQLLRFALMGTTAENTKDGPKHLELDASLQELFHEQWPSNTPLPAWGWSQPVETKLSSEFLLRGLSDDVREIRQLRTLVERHVNGAETGAVIQGSRCQLLSQTLERCQRHSSCSEILSVLNGIIARLDELKVPVSGYLRGLGMQYACMCYSASAFRQHLEGYHGVSPERLDLQASVALVNALIFFVDSIRFDDPDYGLNHILQLVDGAEGSNSGLVSQYNLHNILYWADAEGSTDSIGQYAVLLARLPSCDLLKNVLDRFLGCLFPHSDRHSFHYAYSCVLALSYSRRSEEALDYIKNIARRANNTLPGISSFRCLGALLANPATSETLRQFAGEQELYGIFEGQLKVIEDRLGIMWHPDKAMHSSVSDLRSTASGNPLFNMDGDSNGYDSVHRLIAEIRALGVSKSLVDLGTIANLLDEHDGNEIPVVLPDCRNAGFEFAWWPQRSPIDFSETLSHNSTGTDMSIPWAPSTLGLTCVRMVHNGVMASGSLHLMQLGLLAMRTTNQSNELKPKGRHEWQQTGHIVALDRRTGQLLIVFVEEYRTRALLGTEMQPALSETPSELGIVANLTLPGEKLDELMARNGLMRFQIPGSRLHMEVDSSS